MPRGKRASTDRPRSSQATALSPENRENQLIAMAYDLAEKRILEGTASAQEITHFLKMGSSKERREKEMMEEQKKLMSAKRGSLESNQRLEEIYNKAIKAFQSYSGHEEEEYDE